ncbi:MAG: UvrD-helicase domain-containing protein [Spirochaetes bacterium]|nr:UvrD-helicase domain-containing protein [Spirochaetota bacterium]
MPSRKTFIADFHIHSHFSIATSKKLIPEYLDCWARLKGINIIGTGDCIHPGWLNELKEKLEPAENGLFRLKKDCILREFKTDNENMPRDVFFMLTGEISNIYKKNGKVRKVHNLCVFPDFKSAEDTQRKLAKKFNIESDGRPILGLDSKILLEMVLDSSELSYLIPAHIWTPWFSVLGSKSGFDNIEECYDDLTKHIFAVETGLSTDPVMNRACSFLDSYKLVSNSDAHSPEKLGREANIFDCDPSYEGIYKALSGDKGFLGTIEFFPQEGKYHYDGHRKCEICWDPLETLQHNGLCSVCGKPVTKGVMYRIAELADKDSEEIKKDTADFFSITSLPDLLAEIMNKKNSSAKSVQQEYFRLLELLGSEFHILLSADPADIKKAGGETLSEGIQRLRQGDVIITEGYDGEFGRIKVFSADEIETFSGISLFRQTVKKSSAKTVPDRLSVKFDVKKFQELKKENTEIIATSEVPLTTTFTTEQSQAIQHFEGPCMVIAGPGSGKTRILTERIINLINNNISPENILAVTFSNKAAKEILERVNKIDGSGNAANTAICTFHSFGLSVLKKYYSNFERPEHFYILDPAEKNEILKELTGLNDSKAKKAVNEIEKYKQGITGEIDHAFFESYSKELKIRGAFDLDDLIYLPVELMKSNSEIQSEYSVQYQWLLVDEYQDINEKQYELIMLLASNNNPNLFVIGDPDQSIYGFRGSDTRYIDRLRNSLSGIKVINLSKSYRCPENIIKAASQILRKKKYISGKDEKPKVHIQKAETEKSEADWIAGKIESMIGGVRSFSIDSGISDGTSEEEDTSFSDFAVLCRTSLMFDPIVKAFMDHGIAYQVVGTEPFYNKEPFSSIISNFKRTYYHLINIESSALNVLKDDIREMIKHKNDIKTIISNIMRDKDINEEDRKKMEDFAALYGNDYEKFFLNLSTRQGVDEYNEKAEAVSILTLHASKGLEFNTVFIPGCEQGIIPFELFGKKEKHELEEEERLFYVGITRTVKNLFLSHAGKRSYKGRILKQPRSLLLERIEKGIFKLGSRDKKQSKPENNQLDLFE